jgi:hypothetical protein
VVQALAHLSAVRAPQVAAMATDNDDALRRSVAALLQSGLQTQWQQRADTAEAVNQCVAQLQRLATGDYAGKLRVAGFADRPYDSRDEGMDLSQSCETCMYYSAHRRFCELPELRLPVEPQWSCRLWRI